VGGFGSDVRDFSHGGFVVLVGAIAVEEEVANRASPSPAQFWSFGRVGVVDACMFESKGARVVLTVSTNVREVLKLLMRG
jgi:hypothetical protein